MNGLGKTIRDTVAKQLQQPQVHELTSTATAWVQKAAQRTPGLSKLTEALTPAPPAQPPAPPSRQRPGSRQQVVLGSGKGGAIAITQPGADSSPIEGVPGQILYGEGPVPINVGRDVITLTVVNTADRPITVGSHYHFAEANPGLSFDRKAAWGRRQNIVAGGMTRFDPGAPQEVQLVPFAGRRVAAGFRGDCKGRLDG